MIIILDVLNLVHRIPVACYVIMFINFSRKKVCVYLFIYLSISFICLISFCCSQGRKGKICGRKFRLGRWGYDLSRDNSSLIGADLAQPHPVQPRKILKLVKNFIVTPSQLPPKINFALVFEKLIIYPTWNFLCLTQRHENSKTPSQ